MDATALILIALLGAPSFGTRETASTILAKYPRAMVPLAYAAAGHRDPEIRQRAQAALEPALIELRQHWLAQERTWPEIDCLPPDWPDQDALISYYREQSCCGSDNGHAPEEQEDRRATALFFKDQVGSGQLTTVSALRLLATMQERSEYWAKHHRWPD